MSIETLNPPKIENLFGKPYEAVKSPSRDERVSRQEIMQMTTLIGAPEKAKASRFIEREIDPDKPWSAFGQVMFVKEHIVEGRVIKKIAAVSMAYPGGVGTKMAGEALGETLGIDQSEFQRWDGVKEGGIIAASKEVADVIGQLGLMAGFVENSGSVIGERHAQVDHEVVQHFFGLQETRQGFLETVQQDALRILENPEFTGRSAFDERYEGKGVYLIEGIVVDGEWHGGDPKGKKMRLVDMAADEPHLKWLQWAEKTAAGMKGDGIIVDAEDTETVQHCGGAGGDSCEGNKGCSAFFEVMEGEDKNIITKQHVFAEVSGISGTLRASGTKETSYRSGGGARYDKETCSDCGQYKNEKNECNCSKKH